MTHAHITTWVVALILFVVAIAFQAKGHEKTKMVHMLLRLFYILIIATGAWILHSMSSFPFLYIVKVIVGLWVIGTMEMILVRTAKGKTRTFFGFSSLLRLWSCYISDLNYRLAFLSFRKVGIFANFYLFLPYGNVL
ncbi:hypothetical protein LR68_00761 [Anoxybacillus sp. BCO1]|nr:hypothetical protein LR68_00761 [Anoxybacillus sp. BCO1]